MNAYVAEHRLTLPCQASSASRARSFAHDLLHACGFDALVDDCQLLVSELVTNVVLHAGTEIDLRCFTFLNSVRFEVRDGSSVLPGIRHYESSATTGRGIALVDAISARWGANRETHGKVVWFQVGDADVPSRAPAVVNPVTATAATDDFLVRFEQLPVALVRATVQHGDALLRDITILDMGQHSDPGAWRSPQIDLTPVLGPVDDAHRKGLQSIDVEARFPRRARSGALERLTRINEAEQIARTATTATQSGLPELTACRGWLLSEIALQAEGAPPTAWTLVDDLEPHDPPLTLTPDEKRLLEQTGSAMVVADTTHRIIFASESAGELLGWQVPELTGRRLTVIVPVDQREAHLAGFAHYAITNQPRIIDRTVFVPALRHDGSVVEVALTLHKMQFAAGDAFAAELKEASQLKVPAQ